MLEELQETIGRVATDIGPSVVGLGRGWSHGSGIVIGEGKILTSAHNLRRDEISVTFADGRRAPGSVIGADADADLAVLSVETGDVHALAWADEDAAIGTPVFALSNPGGHNPRVTFGLVSSTGRSFRGARHRRMTDTVEHTAPLPRGSSGGPLVDANGRLLGVNTLRLEGGLILAVAGTSTVRERVAALARGEAPVRRTLGVHVAPPRVARRLRGAVGLPERDGVLVRDVSEGSAASRAGLERGDLIVAAGGRAVERLDDLHTALDRANGDLELTVVRGTDERRVEVELSTA